MHFQGSRNLSLSSFFSRTIDKDGRYRVQFVPRLFLLLDYPFEFLNGVRLTLGRGSAAMIGARNIEGLHALAWVEAEKACKVCLSVKICAESQGGVREEGMEFSDY